MYETAAAQPIQSRIERPLLHLVPDVVAEPEVFASQAAEFEQSAQDEFERWRGSIALQKTVEKAGEKPANINILERARAAADGNEEATQWLKANIATASGEAVFKENYVDDIYMDIGGDGRPVQYGQTDESVHRNAIEFRPKRHSILEAITKVEGLNRFRIGEACSSGLLDTHYFVVPSLTPNGVPEKELGIDGDGYFTDSLSLNVQTTSRSLASKLKTEVTFMAGVDSDGQDSFEERLANRHDFKALAIVYEWLGVKAPKTAEEALHGVFIDKRFMPNGVADFMLWFDKAKDGVLGRQVERKIEDYLALKLESKRKTSSLKAVNQKIFDDLTSVAYQLETPEEASALLWDLVREQTLKDSYENQYIDPKVFGRAAAPDIIMARYHLERGNTEQAELHKEKAFETATVTGCGGGSSGPKSGEDGFSSEESSLDRKYGKDDLGRRWFRCSNGHLNVRPHNKKIPGCQHKGCQAKVKC